MSRSAGEKYIGSEGGDQELKAEGFCRATLG